MPESCLTNRIVSFWGSRRESYMITFGCVGSGEWEWLSSQVGVPRGRTRGKAHMVKKNNVELISRGVSFLSTGAVSGVGSQRYLCLEATGGVFTEGR